jgi:hypothetical protein
MKKTNMADLERNVKLEKLSMNTTHTMEEYLLILKYENIFGQNNEQIESLEVLTKNKNFRNIKIV